MPAAADVFPLALQRWVYLEATHPHLRVQQTGAPQKTKASSAVSETEAEGRALPVRAEAEAEGRALPVRVELGTLGCRRHVAETECVLGRARGCASRRGALSHQRHGAVPAAQLPGAGAK